MSHATKFNEKTEYQKMVGIITKIEKWRVEKEKYNSKIINKIPYATVMIFGFLFLSIGLLLIWYMLLMERESLMNLIDSIDMIRLWMILFFIIILIPWWLPHYHEYRWTQKYIKKEIHWNKYTYKEWYIYFDSKTEKVLYQVCKYWTLIIFLAIVLTLLWIAFLLLKNVSSTSIIMLLLMIIIVLLLRK